MKLFVPSECCRSMDTRSEIESILFEVPAQPPGCRQPRGRAASIHGDAHVVYILALLSADLFESGFRPTDAPIEMIDLRVQRVDHVLQCAQRPKRWDCLTVLVKPDIVLHITPHCFR